MFFPDPCLPRGFAAHRLDICPLPTVRVDRHNHRPPPKGHREWTRKCPLPAQKVYKRPDSANWQFREPVAKHPQESIRKREFTESLRTPDHKEAARRARQMAVEMDALFEKHEARLKGVGDAPQPARLRTRLHLRQCAVASAAYQLPRLIQAP